MPSLERLKPFEGSGGGGGGDDDDDGLDKDLWVVVEKGSVCTSLDCVYRDAVSATRHCRSLIPTFGPSRVFCFFLSHFRRIRIGV